MREVIRITAKGLISMIVGGVIGGAMYLAYLKMDDMWALQSMSNDRVHQYCMSFKLEEDICHCYQIHGRECFGSLDYIEDSDGCD
jgi:hypothetical protein